MLRLAAQAQKKAKLLNNSNISVGDNTTVNNRNEIIPNNVDNNVPNIVGENLNEKLSNAGDISSDSDTDITQKIAIESDVNIEGWFY